MTDNPLVEASARHAAAMPDQPMIHCGERTLTRGEFQQQVARTGSALKSAGLVPGDRLGFLGCNSDVFMVLLQACVRSRIVLVPVNWRLAPAELRYVFDDSGIRLLISDREFLPAIQGLAPGGRIERLLVTEGAVPDRQSFADWIREQPPIPPLPVAPRDDSAMLLYTSGTTGNPKGVLLTHANLINADADAVGTGLPWASWDTQVTGLLASPVFHIAGSALAAFGLMGGAQIVMMPKPDPVAIVAAIARHRVTKVFLVPTLLNMVLNSPSALAGADLSSLRFVLYGASPISTDLLCRAMARLPDAEFVQLYGATETTGTATWLPSADHQTGGSPRMLSCGIPYADTQIRIVDAERQALPPRDIGEIEIQSGCVMKGYFNNPEATQRAIVDGWYRTGDAGYRDEDGYLYICDRIKDMIISGGENIYPAEIENALAGHPAVLACAVIGVPDPRWGEAVKAVVIPRAGSSASAEELREFLRPLLAGYKIPKSVDFVSEFPLTPSGKVLKRELRKPYWVDTKRQVS